MANVVPLVVSGEIQPTQPSILMAIVDSTPYYLVTDVNNNPYFQPLYQDVTTGLDVFAQYAVHVTVTLGARSGNTNSAVITNLHMPGGGSFLANPLIFKIVAPGSIPNAVSIIPLEKLSYADPSLVACGYEYVINGGYGFYTTTNWSATPNLQSISSVQQETPVQGFYVFPIEDLVDSTGAPASASVFSAIYNDVLGKTAPTYLFSSRAAWQIGGGQPYYFCADSTCGPLCFGTCSGTYQGCNRIKDGNFQCAISVSTTCKVIALLPFMIPMIICILAFAIVFFTNKYSHVHPVTGKRMLNTKRVYIFSKRVKVILSVLLIIPAILLIIMMIMASVDTAGSGAYLRFMCRNDYK